MIKFIFNNQQVECDTVDEAIEMLDRSRPHGSAGLPTRMLHVPPVNAIGTKIPRQINIWAKNLSPEEKRVAVLLAVNHPKPMMCCDIMAALNQAEKQVQTRICALRTRGIKLKLDRCAVVTRRLNRDLGGEGSTYALTELGYAAIMRHYPKG